MPHQPSGQVQERVIAALRLLADELEHSGGVVESVSFHDSELGKDVNHIHLRLRLDAVLRHPSGAFAALLGVTGDYT